MDRLTGSWFLFFDWGERVAHFGSDRSSHCLEGKAVTAKETLRSSPSPPAAPGLRSGLGPGWSGRKAAGAVWPWRTTLACQGCLKSPRELAEARAGDTGRSGLVGGLQRWSQRPGPSGTEERVPS